MAVPVPEQPISNVATLADGISDELARARETAVPHRAGQRVLDVGRDARARGDRVGRLRLGIAGVATDLGAAH